MPDPSKPKIVCMCQDGNNRSVHCAGILKGAGYDAVAIGHARAGSSLKSLLFEWADIIIIMQECMRVYVPEQHTGKILVCDVGGDSYWRGWIPQLAENCRTGLRELNLLE